MATRINSYRELRMFQLGMEGAMKIFHLSKRFPSEERYSLTDQIRRSSRSVCSNIAEAWRKRRYEGAFVAKLSDAETEACETQVWIEFCQRCDYLDAKTCAELDDAYDHITAQLVKMVDDSGKWLIKKSTPIRRFPVSPIQKV